MDQDGHELGARVRDVSERVHGHKCHDGSIDDAGTKNMPEYFQQVTEKDVHLLSRPGTFKDAGADTNSRLEREETLAPQLGPHRQEIWTLMI